MREEIYCFFLRVRRSFLWVLHEREKWEWDRSSWDAEWQGGRALDACIPLGTVLCGSKSLVWKGRREKKRTMLSFLCVSPEAPWRTEEV